MLLVNEIDVIHSGIVSSLLFVILALQTGLTGLDPEIRLTLLYESIILINVIWQRYIHDIVNQLLISLNDSYNSSFNR